ncbi:MAG: tRNA lysidine(34) synthetase TilS [Planktomarina sp.]
MHNAVLDFFREWGREQPTNIGVAVSGGSDSIALLRAMHVAFPNAQLHAATVNHGLREGAIGEARFVETLCNQLQIPHTILTVCDLDDGPNLQARARDARYRMLADWGRGFDVVCLGHSQTDVAENFLIRLARGSGADGLAAMDGTWDRHDVTWARPLLMLSREDLRRYLAQIGQTWCDDPSNLDAKFTRVAMRLAQPALDDLGLTAHRLGQTAHRMAKISDALNHSVRREIPNVLHRDLCDVVLDRAALADLPEEISERIYAMALGWVGGRPYRPRNDALLRVMSSHDASTLHGCVLVPERNSLTRISREYNAVSNLESPCSGPWDGRFSAPKYDHNHHMAALGALGLKQCDDWRATGRPRIALLSSPAIWCGDQVILAPMAGLGQKECVQIAQPPWESALTR